MKASAKERQIEELRRKIEDKNKEVVKSKDDAAKMIEDMRKDCNSKFQKDQFSNLSKDFTEMKGTMEKLLKSKKGEDAENSKLKEALKSAKESKPVVNLQELEEMRRQHDATVTRLKEEIGNKNIELASLRVDVERGELQIKKRCDVLQVNWKFF